MTGYVKTIQQLLKKMGFDPGPVDGVFGNRTRAALAKALPTKGRKPKVTTGAGFVLSARDKTRLKGVHPDLVKVVVEAAISSPVKFMVLEGKRTVARQRKLVASGASKTMRSRHLTGHAVDLAPIVDGKISWAWPVYNILGPHIEATAKKLGVQIKWGGRWKRFKDGPHFQLKWRYYP